MCMCVSGSPRKSAMKTNYIVICVINNFALSVIKYTGQSLMRNGECTHERKKPGTCAPAR